MKQEWSGVSIDIPAKGERWDCSRINQTARVMADPVEGYVMVRFKGASPFLVHLSDWHKRFTRKPTP